MGLTDLGGQRAAEIAAQREAMLKAWPAAWRRMAVGWAAEGPDAVWLMFAASYLGRTQGTRWAMDPVVLSSRLSGAPIAPVAEVLRQAHVILLTHAHSDHLDQALYAALATADLTWVMPPEVRERITAHVAIAPERIITPVPGRVLQFGGLCVMPFAGGHWEWAPDADPAGPPTNGIPATGYLIEGPTGRWLFPGDTRTYDPARRPDLGPVDVVFAHVWLGRDAALCRPPPLLESFCRYFTGWGARQIALTHLHEVGRDPGNYWDLGHAAAVRARLAEVAPEVTVAVPAIGDQVLLPAPPEASA